MDVQRSRQQCLMLVRKTAENFAVMGLGTLSIASHIDEAASRITFGCPACGRTITSSYDINATGPDGLAEQKAVCTLYLTHTKRCPLLAHLQRESVRNGVDFSVPWWGQGEWEKLRAVVSPPEAHGYHPEMLRRHLEDVADRMKRHDQN
jgi:hypothetical protein